MAQHTPGPWRWVRDGRLVAGDHETLLGIFTEGPGLGFSAGPNINLIAAAPDLLEALRDLVAVIDQRSKLHMQYYVTQKLPGLAAARTAILKAEGDK